MALITYYVAALCLMMPVGFGRDSTGTQVRLVGPGDDIDGLIGRVEIFVCTKLGCGWATICVHKFDDNDANVVCKQVGYGSGHVYVQAHIPGSGLMCPYRWHCTGAESSLYWCPRQWYPITCSHYYDAVVHCHNDLIDPPP